jgi:hypothetical protein
MAKDNPNFRTGYNAVIVEILLPVFPCIAKTKIFSDALFFILF